MTDEETAEAEAAEKEEEAKEAATAEEEGGETPSELEELQATLAETKTQAEEYLDGWQRAQAEFSNYKKRQQAERAKVRQLVNAQLLRKLLPILDDFERAVMTLPDSLRQFTWCEGVFLIKRKLDVVLESEGVTLIETDGEMFDPRYHEAVTHEEAPGYEEGQIIGEVQQGYMLDDLVLRPALVRVAKASVDQPDEETGPETDDEENSKE